MYMHTVILLPTVITFCKVAVYTELVNTKLSLPGKYGALSREPLLTLPSTHQYIPRCMCVSLCVFLFFLFVFVCVCVSV